MTLETVYGFFATFDSTRSASSRRTKKAAALLAAAFAAFAVAASGRAEGNLVCGIDLIPVAGVLPCVPLPDPDPNAPPSFSYYLSGTTRTKGDDFQSSEVYPLHLNFDTAVLTFLAMDADGTLYSGRLAPKGTKGEKFSLYLDETSAEAFATDVAARGAAASSRATGAALGDHSKWTLQLGDGSISLKIKSEVLVEGVGEVVFKAQLKER